MNKRMVKGIVIVLAALLVAWAAPAQTVNNEVLYLADTMTDWDGLSAIYRVEMQNGVANLVLLPNGILPYNHADVIAAEPDGSKIWFIDDFYGGTTDTGTFGWYSVTDATVHAVGMVTYQGQRMVQIDQAAVAPDGTLYIANNLTDSIYTLDKNTAVATLVGVVMTPQGLPVDVGGADIAFAADGTFYLWINLGSPAGLYTLQLPAVNGIVNATWIGGTQDSERRFTGLAIRANGVGDLVGSITKGLFANTVVVVDKTTGLFTEIYPMARDGLVFDHTWGDMSIGPFPKPPGDTNPVTFCTYTIGYWKNHSWQGQTITILGVVVDEAAGKLILSNAKSKNMSMLFAQLIAAKLNVKNASGLAAIDGAEDYLVELDNLTADIVKFNAAGVPYLNWNRAFGSDTVKQLATYWSGLLDEFNNIYHCLDDAPVAPNTTSAGKKK